RGIVFHGVSLLREVLAGFSTRHDTPPSQAPSPIFSHSSADQRLRLRRFHGSAQSLNPYAGLALLETGDRIRIDLNQRAVGILASEEELARRRAEWKGQGGYNYPESQTPWQEIQRVIVDQLADGMILKPAVRFQKIAQTFGVPRDSH
ncbi:dihydroxy-acid dehydratase, partial [Aurantimonas sp. C2-4-R8]|nr:dihydroxy-acid dehydratase [Aurantimonas sp. C2-4-R8]